MSDSAIANWSRHNRPHHVAAIDINGALAKLPPRSARAIRLVYFEEYSAAEAAEVMDCSRERVRKILQEARDRLRVLLPGYTLKGNANTIALDCKAQVSIAAKPVVSDSSVPPRKGPVSVTVPMHDESKQQPTQTVMG